MPETVIETKGLTKRYSGFTAVDNLNLAIQHGEVFGLLGPNGSGKTTTILMLLGLTEPTAGQVRVLGLDPVRQPLTVKAHVGYLPDQVGFYENLTARENLNYIAKLNSIPRPEATARIEEMVARMGLAANIDQRVGTFSRGMRQRLGLAELLLKRPQIIIMDEPTLGLDPDAARLFLRIIGDLRAEGITIMLSSHLLHQVQAVCDRVGLFHQGRIVLEGRVPDLARRILGGAYHVRLTAEGDTSEMITALKGLPGALNVQQSDSNQFVIEATTDLRPQAARAIVETGGYLHSLTVEEPNLDEIYAQYFEEEVQHEYAN